MHLGRPISGGSILIHSAAGEVGIAAIQIAKRVGTRVVGLREALVISMSI